jgi:hypothetical protein
MFQLIISILAILLAVSLAGVSIFYGSDSFTGGKDKAEAVTIINQASQIEAAMTLYNSNNSGQLDIGGRTGYDDSDGTNGGLFEYMVAEGNDYLKSEPLISERVWEVRCEDGANQAAFEASDEASDCGAEGVSLTLNGIVPKQCNLINVLMDYKYVTTASNSSGSGTAGENATEDGYVPFCSDEENAPCCDSV